MRFSVVLLALGASLVGQGTRPVAPRLVKVSSIVLNKRSGSVDQIVQLDSGRYVVLDATLDPLSSQSVEIFDKDGRSTRKIGRFGESAGAYYAVGNVGVTHRDGLIWVLDRKGRLSKFNADGVLKGTMLIQAPGYTPHGLVIDEAHGFFYLTGCVPERVYLDLGCLLVHQYNESSDKFQHSFVETEPVAVERHYLRIEDYQIDVAADGTVLVIDAPIRKVWRIGLRNGQVDNWPISSRVFEDIPKLDPTGREDLSSTYHLAERVFATGPYVVVSVRKPRNSGYLLQVFDAQGRQIAMDLEAPGRLVGKSNDGLWFVDLRTGNGQPFRLSNFKIVL